MIPLRDENKSRSFPFVTMLVILINGAVFFYQWKFGPRGVEVYILSFGIVPAEISGGRVPLTLITAMFMHGGIGHLVSNMWFLWIFGDNVEDALGRIRFIFFYLTTGILASLAHIAVHASSRDPLIGASGAIAGVLGAYIVLFPRHRILTLVPFLFLHVVRIPAAFFLGLWFMTQLLYSQMGGNVAWWAHIGGFATGFALVGLFRRKR